MDSTDDSTTDQQILQVTAGKIETPLIANETHGPSDDPASGLVRTGNSVYARKKTVSQVRAHVEACANLTIKRNLTVVPGGETVRTDIEELLFGDEHHPFFTKRFFDVKNRYEYWSVDDFTIQVQATANWLLAGGVLVVAYTHDPVRENKKPITRQCDMYMTRITDNQKINIPIRTDWFYCCKRLKPVEPFHQDLRFTSPGVVNFHVRGLGGTQEDYKTTVTITANVKFAVPSLILPEYMENDAYAAIFRYLKIDPAFAPITQPAKPLPGQTTIIQFKMIGTIAFDTPKSRHLHSPITFTESVRLNYKLTHETLPTIHRCMEFNSIVYKLEPGTDTALLGFTLNPPQGYTVALEPSAQTTLLSIPQLAQAIVLDTIPAPQDLSTLINI